MAPGEKEAMTDQKLDLAILIPVRNESINIVIMLRILRAVLDIPHEILIIYDDPNDVSIPTVNAHFPNDPCIRLVHNQRGRGVSHALQAGIAAAKNSVLLVFAVDEVGPVLAIKDMASLIRQGCDFVSCTRYAHQGRRLGGSLIGGILSRTANRLFKIFSGCQLSDSTTGIKMFRKSAVQKMKFEANPVGWAVAYELSIKAEAMGLQVGEVPIVSIDRLYGGESTFSLGPWVREYLRWFFWGVRQMRSASQNRPPLMVRIPKWDVDYFEKDTSATHG